MNPELYVYKMVADNGGAPCVWRGMLSLTICKPKIRRSAKVGSIVFGFGGKELGERLLYIAEITEKLPTGAYYREPRYAIRPDCLYEPDSAGAAVRKPTARYHTASDQRARDIGMGFEHAEVLLSDNFRYLGNRGHAGYKDQFSAVKNLIEALRRGHRVNHSVALRGELLRLKAQVWAEYPQSKIGTPSESEELKLCTRDSPSAAC